MSDGSVKKVSWLKRASFWSLGRLGFEGKLESLESRDTPSIASTFAGGLSLTSGAPVNISKLSADQAESHIMIDPTNPARMFSVSNHDGVATGMFGAFSVDAGQNWTKRTVGTGSDGIAGACCDGQLAWDNHGNLYMVYLSSSITTIVARSTDGGQTFSQIFTGPSSDQPVIAVGQNMVWIAYNRSGLMRARGATSTGLGVTGAFSAEQTVSANSGNYAGIAIGPTGQVAVTFTTSGGQGPNASVFTAVDADGLGGGGFANAATVITQVGGFDFIPAQSTRSVDSEPGVVYDALGRLYLVYTDETVNENNDTEILVRTSDNNGTTWSAPVRVNDDATTRSQFLPQIQYDQDTGFIAVTWHDARNSAGNNTAQFYGSFSVDRGATFLPNIQIGPGVSNALLSSSSTDYGDYSGLSLVGGSFFPIWADNSNSTGDNPAGGGSTFDLYTARARLQSVGGQTVTATGSAGGDQYNIKLDDSGTYVMFYENNPGMTGKPTYTVTKASLQAIVINSGAGNDNVIVDFTNGNPIPAGGIAYNGGGDIDRITAVTDANFTLTDAAFGISGTAGGTLVAVERATLTGGASANTYNISSWTGIADLNGQNGADIYNITFSGTVGGENVSDSGASGVDLLNVTSTAAVDTVGVTGGSVTRGSELVAYIGIDAVRVNTVGAGDIVNVLGNSVVTNIIGGAAATVNIGNAGSVQAIIASLNIENPPNFNTITIDNSADGVGRNVVVSALATNPENVGGSNGPWSRVAGLAPGNINIELPDIPSATGFSILAGTAADTFNVAPDASLSLRPITINAGNPPFPDITTSDFLTLNLAGIVSPTLNPTANGAGTWTFSNAGAVNFSNFERMTPGIAISGRVFQDLDGNGNDNAGADPGMVGVTVNLDSLADGPADRTTLSGAGGSYSFTDLAPGLYRIRQTVPGGFFQTSTNPADLLFSAPLANSGINFGNSNAPVDTTAPTVTGIFFAGSTWGAPFRTAAGNASFGFPGQTGANQLLSLPWNNLNEIVVTFSEAVAAPAGLLSGQVGVRGANGGTYALTSVTAVSASTWRILLTTAPDTDWLIVDLDGDGGGGATRIEDLAGNDLAGTFTESVSTFPTTGAAGVDFKYRFKVVVGDQGRNGTVRNVDLNAVRNNLFIDIGAGGYDIFTDIDANGLLRNADLNAVRNHLFIDAPAVGPTRPNGGGANASRGTAANSGSTRFSSAGTINVNSTTINRRLAPRAATLSLDALFAEI